MVSGCFIQLRSLLMMLVIQTYVFAIAYTNRQVNLGNRDTVRYISSVLEKLRTNENSTNHDRFKSVLFQRLCETALSSSPLCDRQGWTGNLCVLEKNKPGVSCLALQKCAPLTVRLTNTMDTHTRSPIIIRAETITGVTRIIRLGYKNVPGKLFKSRLR